MATTNLASTGALSIYTIRNFAYDPLADAPATVYSWGNRTGANGYATVGMTGGSTIYGQYDLNYYRGRYRSVVTGGSSYVDNTFPSGAISIFDFYSTTPVIDACACACDCLCK